MKDSQIGTYGTLALIVATGLRWLAYAHLLQTSIAVIVAVAAASRAILPALLCELPNARNNRLSHDVGRPNLKHALVAAGIGLLLAVVLLIWLGFVVMLSVVLAVVAMEWLARAKISGQAGDVLGATQQIAEVAALTALVALT